MTEPIALPNPGNLSFGEDLYQAFLRDPAAVDARWRGYFESLDGVNGARAGWQRGPSFRPRGLFDSATPFRSWPQPTSLASAARRRGSRTSGE
jgi:2-oxoglutarate dehydrogenase complex dehydrogenase (E1) component-like enzyme